SALPDLAAALSSAAVIDDDQGQAEQALFEVQTGQINRATAVAPPGGPGLAPLHSLRIGAADRDRRRLFPGDAAENLLRLPGDRRAYPAHPRTHGRGAPRAIGGSEDGKTRGGRSAAGGARQWAAGIASGRTAPP